ATSATTPAGVTTSADSNDSGNRRPHQSTQVETTAVCNPAARAWRATSSTPAARSVSLVRTPESRGGTPASSATYCAAEYVGGSSHVAARAPSSPSRGRNGSGAATSARRPSITTSSTRRGAV